MNNEAARDRLTNLVARLRDQLADIVSLQKKQEALKLSARTADGTVEVTVNARGQVVKTVIDKTYLDDHDFHNLADYITETAQTAARDAAQRVAEILAPINERHKNFPKFSDIVEGMPDLSDLMPPGLGAFAPAPPRREDRSVFPAGGSYDDGDVEGGFPTVRR